MGEAAGATSSGLRKWQTQTGPSTPGAGVSPMKGLCHRGGQTSASMWEACSGCWEGRGTGWDLANASFLHLRGLPAPQGQDLTELPIFPSPKWLAHYRPPRSAELELGCRGAT